MMMLLILRAQSFENLDRLLLTRLFDHNRLETALKCCILLNILAVLLDSRRADQLDLSACKRRFQDIGRIDCALSSTSSDDRVNLVDEKQNLSILANLGDHFLDALLKLTAIL